MKPSVLTVASMVSVILLPFHVGGDIAFGFDKGGSGLAFVVVPILLLVTIGALVLDGTRSGYIIMFLGGLAALAMPVIHRNNGFSPEVARLPGGIFFMWTLVVLGVSGGLAMILSVRGLLGSGSRKI